MKIPQLRPIYFSFPYRLLLLHVRNHLILITVWLFLGLLMTGLVGKFFGVNYLMLTPEYLGRVNWASYFLLGAAFGALFMVWNLTTYLLCSSRFPFLATLNAPFTKFCINNSLIPIVFIVVWLVASIRFQYWEELWTPLFILKNIGGFVGGFAVFVGILAIYFQLSNKDIGDFLQTHKSVFLSANFPKTSRRLPGIHEIRTGRNAWRCDSYLNEKLRPRIVRSVEHYDRKVLSAVFSQNHFNAVVVQVAAMLLLMVLGLFMDNPRCQIPTGASILILGSMVIALFGAIRFWFEKWGTIAFLTLIFCVNWISGHGWLAHWNQAYGLDYQSVTKARYDYENLQLMASADSVAVDRRATEAILEKWKLKLSSEFQVPNSKLETRNSELETRNLKKPKMVFLCVSGGGMRAAVWSMQCLQKADSATGGDLMKHAVLMSGASGGMLGATWFRELVLREKMGEKLDPHNPVFLKKISRDLLNPVSFAIVSNDLFFPVREFSWGKHQYRRDRGYMFERQLWKNTDGFLKKKISDYRQPEADAVIPMAFVTPFILNDARRLIISPQPVSYMMQPTAKPLNINDLEIDAVDFRRLFAGLDADDLSFASALRMNATYPYILPNTHLPTSPEIETMDAGFRDNYGTLSAIRFLHVFQDWVKENTSGIVFVEMRCWPKVHAIEPSNKRGWVDGLLHPATVTSRLTDMQDFGQDEMMGLLADIFGEKKVDRLLFTYQPVRKESEASMSLHLSQRERIDLENAFFSKENQASLARLLEILGN